MLPPTLVSFSFAFLLPHLVTADVQPFTSYANDFVDPSYIAARQFPNTTGGAQASIRSWADRLASSGPWSVTTKPMVAPSGDKKDYMSWAPYWWPDCSKVGNTTVLTPEQIWVTCPYVNRDGQFNPDRLTINDIGAFYNVSDAILYNALAFAFENKTSSIYSQRIVKIVETWFLDKTTGMNPNLNYAQMTRGPTGQVGTHTGVLDLKGMAKVVSGILTLRKLKSSDWTDDIDSRLITWANQYINWLETSKLGVDECASLNNHGSYCFNQWASLKLLVNDIPGAVNISNRFFQGIYQGQIDASGDQPFEATRTHPYHYRNYNLGAMITNARIFQYADPKADPWHTKTKAGTTIKDAMDMTMTVDPNKSQEDYAVAEIFPNVAAVAAEYGDPDGKYVAFLQKTFPDYAWDADFLWNQPLVGNAVVQVGATNGTAKGGNTSAPPPGVSGALRGTLHGDFTLFVATLVVVVVVLL
ncbi:Chondroitin AC/alginate lyase [Mycena indigotica]|uniref:Chondroitin AC/alginate lyase n=1 Tax=Mycena indigotica TaxID=2126181 RepID=A0A8H6VV48_9AGAR|nr:Chondroitin AC/alginate lyase [Mycena indigotica]KAF7293086.1 Chondroitin AC/alginate lyase [Mycena indigotica]